MPEKRPPYESPSTSFLTWLKGVIKKNLSPKEQQPTTPKQQAKEAFLLLDAAGPEGQQIQVTFHKENTFDFSKYPSGTVCRFKYSYADNDRTRYSFFVILQTTTANSELETKVFTPAHWKNDSRDNGYFFKIGDLHLFDVIERKLPSNSLVVKDVGEVFKSQNPLFSDEVILIGEIDILQFGKTEKNLAKSKRNPLLGELIPGFNPD